MTAKVLELDNILEPDRLAIQISEQNLEWNMLRQGRMSDWDEIKRYEIGRAHV